MNNNKRYPLPEEILPHRFPILQIDFIEQFIENKSITAIKKIFADNPYLEGHFPTYPIMPGVIVVEMMFQCCGLYLRLMEKNINNNFSDRGGRAISIEKINFKKEVVPETTLRIFVEPYMSILKFRKFKVAAKDYTSGAVYAEGLVTVSL